jgi:hypothetical protein
VRDWFQGFAFSNLTCARLRPGGDKDASKSRSKSKSKKGKGKDPAADDDAEEEDELDILRREEEVGLSLPGCQIGLVTDWWITE